MFFCAGFFHCFLILNKTENGCKQKCDGLNARIPGPGDYKHFDSAREFLEKRKRAKLTKSERNQEIQLPGDKKQTRLYTHVFFDFTSKKWINGHEMYDHSDISFISTSYSHGVGRASDQQCKEILRVSLPVIKGVAALEFTV